MKQWSVAALCLVASVSCGKKSASPTTPTTPITPTLTAPSLDAPAERTQLATLRPTLTVRNGSSDQTGTRTYEFQISDQSAFTSTTSASLFSVVVNRTGVAEGTNGKTSFTPDQDLQPTTRFYWRVRMVQDTTVSAWSATGTFNSKLVGYNRAGELYDPLIHDETVGTIFGSATWVTGKGIRLNDQNAFVRYQLPQTLTSGEFSVEIEGLHANGPGPKLKLFSMMDGTGDLFGNKHLFVTQYRGINGNPPNCIAFKAVFGDEDYKLEPDIGVRTASVQALDPARTYYWKATWGNFFHLLVQADGIGGQTVYDYGVQAPGGSYAPPQPYAYLGANNAIYGEEEGTFPGATYRNLWLSNRPRPASLGSALSSYALQATH